MIHWIDLLIVVVPLAAVFFLAYYSKRYVRSVADFLAAGRVAGRYVIAVGDMTAALSVITVISLVESQYQSGLGITFWNNLLIPVTIFLSCFVAGRESGEKSSVKVKVPWFIPGFLIAAAIYTFLPKYLPCCAEAGKFIKDISKYLMVLTLFFIGANLSREKLRELGIKPIVHGVILWVMLSVIWGVFIVSGIVKCAK